MSEYLSDQDRALCEKLGCFSNGSPWEEELARDAQARIRELSAELNDHPTAEDYRNRAERAEQALAEMAGWDGLSLAVALTQCQAKLAAAEADADRLAEALEDVGCYVRDAAKGKLADAASGEIISPQMGQDDCARMESALAAHAARKIDG